MTTLSYDKVAIDKKENNYLYVGAKVTDGSLIANDSSAPYQDDAIELFVDGEHNKGTSYDTHDRQFVVELAIPWSNLGITPTAGMR